MKTLIAGILAMAAIVVASNILVQHTFGAYLTYGAFTYPLSFLVNDIINRLAGVKAARRVVLAGFVVGLACSFIGTQLHNDYGPLVTLRVALGSGTAFLVGQLLDITVFNRFRRQSWWRAPLIGSVFGSVIDTALFFSLAFAGDVEMSGPVDFMGLSLPLWQSLAICDFLVKMLLALLALVPYGALLRAIRPLEQAEKAAA